MVNVLLLLFVVIFMVIYSKEEVNVVFDKLHQQHEAVGSALFTAGDYKLGLLKHIVPFKYKNNVTQSQRDDVTNRFLLFKSSKRLGEGSPYILSIVEGMQNSGEGAAGGFEQAFIVTFKSEGDRNYYVGRPIVETRGNYDETHDAFKRTVGPLLHEESGVLVFDFSLR